MKNVLENYTILTGKPTLPPHGHLDYGSQLHF